MEEEHLRNLTVDTNHYMSDTNSRAGKEVPIWKLEQRFVEPVKNVLAERYGLDASESLENVLFNAAETYVNDNYQDYLAELMAAKTGSLLGELDEDSTRAYMVTVLSHSVGYMLHIRCGLPGRAYFVNSLDKVCDFNTSEVIMNDQPKAENTAHLTAINPQAIGRLDYLDSRGQVGEQVEYTDAAEFVAQVAEDADVGVPFTITLYRDQNGNTIPQDFLTELGTLPKGFAVVNYAEGHREYLLNESIRMINLYALECFEEEADFSDLTAVPLAYSTTDDSMHSIQVDADLECSRIQYSVDYEEVARIQFADLDDMNEFLARILLNLDKRENEIVDSEPDEGEPKEKKREMER